MDPPNTNRKNFGQEMTIGQILNSRTTWTLLLTVGAICALVFLFPMLSGEKTNQEAGKESEPQTVFVNLATLRELPEMHIPIWYSGEVRAKRRTEVGFARGGKVDEILFEEGDFVEEEDRLAVLGSRQAVARLKQLQAEVNVARAVRDELSEGPRSETIRSATADVKDLEQQLENAVVDFQRSTRLLAKRGISQQEFDQSELGVKSLRAKMAAARAQLELLETGTRQEQVDAAEARLAAATAAVELAQADVDDCTLKAPFSGMIVRRMLDEGAIVSAGTPLFSLMETDHLEFHVGVPAELANTISPGQKFSINFGETEADATLKSKVRTLDVATLTRKIVFALDETASEQGIVNGQIGQIQFEQVTKNKCFRIPVTAIVNDQQGLWSCYTVSKSDGEQIAKRQSIEVLHFDGEWVFVRGTLSDGQSIVTDGLQRLSSGQFVHGVEPTHTAKAPESLSLEDGEPLNGSLRKVEAK